MRSINADEHRAACVIAVCGLVFEAAIAAGSDVVTLCGVGSALLEESLAREMPRCRGIISFGTAGGLDPSLPPGACVIADAVVSSAGRFDADAAWLRALQTCLPYATRGTLAGVDLPIAGVADKTRLWQRTGAHAADMESHRAALLAQRHGVPFAACRVVLDPAQRGLPAAAMAGLREGGTIAVMPVLRALGAHPGQLAALIGLAANTVRAKRVLRAVRSGTGVAFANPVHPFR